MGSVSKRQRAVTCCWVDESFGPRPGWSEVEQHEISKSSKWRQSQKPTSRSSCQKEKAPAVFDEDHFTWVTSLMEFPLFFNLPPSNMEALLEKFERVDVDSDQVIIREGDEEITSTC